MNTPIMRVREKRMDIVRILSIAIFLALALNFFTSYLSIVFSESPFLLLLFGSMCLLIGVFLLKQIIFGNTEYTVRISGAVSYKLIESSVEHTEIFGYQFNKDFCAYLHAFVHENNAYFNLLSDGESQLNHTIKFDPDKLNHHTIINSVFEFTLLNKIHLHLNGYFTENEIDNSGIVTLTRHELGSEVLKNRVIDQLTRDMKERPAFSEDLDLPTEGEVIYSRGRDGIVYQNLDLELPPKSKITRNEDGYLIISNPILDLTIIPRYEGFSTSLPRDLIRSKDEFLDLRLVSLKMHIRVKITAFLTNESMELYEWLDSLVETIQDYVSTDRLTRRLDTDLVAMLTHVSTDVVRE